MLYFLLYITTMSSLQVFRRCSLIFYTSLASLQCVGRSVARVEGAMVLIKKKVLICLLWFSTVRLIYGWIMNSCRTWWSNNLPRPSWSTQGVVADWLNTRYQFLTCKNRCMSPEIQNEYSKMQSEVNIEQRQFDQPSHIRSDMVQMTC